MSDNNLPGGDHTTPPVTPVTPPTPPPVAPPSAAGPAPSGWPEAPSAAPGAPGAYTAAPPAGNYPPQQPYGGMGAPLPPKPKGLALSAMIVGIVSLVLCAIPFIGILGGIAALVLGIIALKKAQSKGMSLTGIITGALAIVVAIVLLVVSLVFLGWATTSGTDALDSLEQQLEELEDTPVTPTPAPEPTPDTDDSTETGDDNSGSTGEWTSIAVISGNADQQTDTLKFSGDKIRLTYDFADSSGLGTIVGAIYVLPEGTDLMTDGGIPEVTITKPGQGETLLRKAPGEYYVKVMAANSDYTVTVEEMG